MFHACALSMRSDRWSPLAASAAGDGRIRPPNPGLTAAVAVRTRDLATVRACGPESSRMRLRSRLSGQWQRQATDQAYRACNPLVVEPAAAQVHSSRGSSRHPRLVLHGAHNLSRARSPAARWSLASSSCRRSYKSALLTISGSRYLGTGLPKRLSAPAS